MKTRIPNNIPIYVDTDSISLSMATTEAVLSVSDRYVLTSDLKKLSDRVVTTHSESSDTTGDSQEIRGNKKFLDSPTVDLRNNNGLIFSYGNTSRAKITDLRDMGIRFTALGDTAVVGQCFEFYSDVTRIMDMTHNSDDTFTVHVEADMYSKSYIAKDDESGTYVDGTYVEVKPNGLSFFKKGNNNTSHRMAIVSYSMRGIPKLNVTFDESEILHLESDLIYIASTVKPKASSVSLGSVTNSFTDVYSDKLHCNSIQLLSSSNPLAIENSAEINGNLIVNDRFYGRFPVGEKVGNSTIELKWGSLVLVSMPSNQFNPVRHYGDFIETGPNSKLYQSSIPIYNTDKNRMEYNEYCELKDGVIYQIMSEPILVPKINLTSDGDSYSPISLYFFFVQYDSTP